jgi:hypothetical protein
MSQVAAQAKFIIGSLREDRLLIGHRNGKCKLTKKGEKEIGISSSVDDD